MKIGDPVRLYDGPWFNEGKIISINGNTILVDYCDWTQEYQSDDLSICFIYYEEIWVPTAPGILIKDYRT